MTKHGIAAWRWDRVLGVVLVVLAVATVLTTVSINQRIERVASCQAQVNRAFQQSLDGRTQAADLERAAQRDLLTTVAGHNRAATDAALQRYQQVLHHADETRDSSPLPPYGRCR